MNRAILLLVGVFSVPSLLLVDSAVKGTALLLLALVVATGLRRDSAATRHLVWLLAIVAMLAVPVLSAMLPQWRVLPEWASIPAATDVASVNLLPIDGPAGGAAHLTQSAIPDGVESQTPPPSQPSALPVPQPAKLASAAVPASAGWSWTWRNALPLVWAVGFCVLIVRLLAARWLLWNIERQGTVVWSSRRPANAAGDPIITALESAIVQLGMRRPVTLLVHAGRTIPVVWGVFRFRLLIPAAARDWSEEQLRSVLRHELAHIKRRDTLAQLLAQVACALHWFNPLVWLAVWRLGVERERACDDLVLASGVRPSAYAGHLLEVVTNLTPNRWTQSCGLAMARKSSLEGRLVAVLSENRSRRGVSLALGAIALAIAAAVAVPIAMLRAAEEVPAVPEQPKESQPAAKATDDSQHATVGEKLPGRLFVNAGLRTVQDERRISQSAIAIDPNTGSWTRLQKLNESGMSVPLWPVRVSPDGRTMLFMREEEIWKCDAVTGEGAVRVFDKGQPKAWSPDGKEFIVAVEKDANRSDSTENWRVSADGKTQTVLPLPIGEVVEDWSADGRSLVGWSHADGQLFIVAPDGSGRRQLTNTSGRAGRNEHARFSPDGRRVVYRRMLFQLADDAPDSRWSMRMINVDGTDDRQILRETAVRPPAAEPAWTAPWAARWSPDGKHLAVVFCDHGRDGGILAINGNWRLAIMDPDGGNLRELTLEGIVTAVLQGDGPEWRPAATGGAAPEPTKGVKLQPGLEERLQWGEAVRGLRAALVRPAGLGEPEVRETFDLKLVVQNVSDAAIRFSTTSASSKNPNLIIRDDRRPVAGFGGSRPVPTDVLLQPREAAVMRLFPEVVEGESIVKEDPKYSYSVDLEIATAPAGAWTGKLVTAPMAAAYSGHGLLPKQEDARALFKIWNAGARRDGKIPGALVGLLAESVTTYTNYNPTWATTPQLLKMLPRLDSTRDWGGQEALDLLDELAAVEGSPLSMAVDSEYERNIQTGAPLPPELAGAPWGGTLPNGLRMAWLLTPRGTEHRLGTPLKSQILIHNAGKDAVVFRTRTWHQSAAHKARDANGAEIGISGISWTTRGRLVPFRLAPGEFVELTAAGIGVGAVDKDDRLESRIGATIEAKAGDEVTFTPDVVHLSDWNGGPPGAGQPGWWLDFITARLRRHLPLPADADARKLLLYRVAMELFGTPVGEEINAAFIADREATALDSLAKRLERNPGLTAYTGSLESGPTTFRVLPADPRAATRPRTASGPGLCVLDEHIRLFVSRHQVGARTVNEAYIKFFPPDAKSAPPGEPVTVQLPDGYNTWAAAWVRGGTVLWVQQKSGIRSYDFLNPADVRETKFEGPADLQKVPLSILEALRAEVGVLAVPTRGPRPAAEAPRPATEAPK